MRRVLVIGIGAGDPDHVTVQAIAALNAAEVFFVMDKGAAKHELVRLRREICERYIEDTSYRIVEVRDPQRDRSAPDYAAAVAAWRSARADVWEDLIARELGEDGCGAFLVWGDPALYDSTIAVLDEIATRGRVAFEFEVIPGISSVQALAAAHRVPLNRVGEPIEITTGRRLLERLDDDDDEGDVVVMLDAGTAFDAIEDRDTEIYWGAYVGTEHEILVAGKLCDVAAEIVRLRAEARDRHGWIMDVYLLRRRSPRE
ncbi:MAG TPA: precorrin-6A synthase (deacetylating) [Solirubrobacteraceae bacterium]|jgi:precorrin-6A synthase|nr:precorrin-6A synthase (deacetylating) [Solirubrobacteraceae bacterium]